MLQVLINVRMIKFCLCTQQRPKLISRQIRESWVKASTKNFTAHCSSSAQAQGIQTGLYNLKSSKREPPAQHWIWCIHFAVKCTYIAMLVLLACAAFCHHFVSHYWGTEEGGTGIFHFFPWWSQPVTWTPAFRLTFFWLDSHLGTFLFTPQAISERDKAHQEKPWVGSLLRTPNTDLI